MMKVSIVTDNGREFNTEYATLPRIGERIATYKNGLETWQVINVAHFPIQPPADDADKPTTILVVEPIRHIYG